MKEDKSVLVILCGVLVFLLALLGYMRSQLLRMQRMCQFMAAIMRKRRMNCVIRL